MAGRLVADVTVGVVADVVKVIFVFFFSSVLSAEDAIAFNDYAVAVGTAFKLRASACSSE